MKTWGPLAGEAGWCNVFPKSGWEGQALQHGEPSTLEISWLDSCSMKNGGFPKFNGGTQFFSSHGWPWGLILKQPWWRLGIPQPSWWLYHLVKVAPVLADFDSSGFVRGGLSTAAASPQLRRFDVLRRLVQGLTKVFAQAGIDQSFAQVWLWEFLAAFHCDIV